MRLVVSIRVSLLELRFLFVKRQLLTLTNRRHSQLLEQLNFSGGRVQLDDSRGWVGTRLLYP